MNLVGKVSVQFYKEKMKEDEHWCSASSYLNHWKFSDIIQLLKALHLKVQTKTLKYSTDSVSLSLQYMLGRDASNMRLSGVLSRRIGIFHFIMNGKLLEHFWDHGTVPSTGLVSRDFPTVSRYHAYITELCTLIFLWDSQRIKHMLFQRFREKVPALYKAYIN